MEISPLIDFMLQRGGNETTIMLLLMLPIIATIVSVARYIIGIKSFGIFTPVLLAVAYASISKDVKTSLIYGITVTAIVILSTLVLQYILDVNKFKIFRMHYIPKLGIIMTSVTIILFLTLLAAASLDKSLAGIDPLPFLLIVTLVEDFTTKAFKKGFKSALGITFETVTLAILGYLLIIAEPLKEFLFLRPEIVLLTIPLNFLVGKFAGLRLKELLRFADIGNDD